MTGRELFKLFCRLSEGQRARVYSKITNLDKSHLITTTMLRYGVQFEPAEHIVELAVGDRDLKTLSLAEASMLIVEVGDSLVGKV